MSTKRRSQPTPTTKIPDALPPEILSLKREINRLQRCLVDSSTKNKLIVEAVREVYIDPPNFILPSRPAPDRRNKRFHDNREIAVLHISDVHVGKRTKSYNSTVANDRMGILVDKTIEITDTRRSFAKIDEIHIYLGGDVIEGEMIFSHQPHLIDSNVLEQALKTAPEICANAIFRLSESFSKLKVCAVPGNHGRNGGKHTTAHPKTNWDTVCYETIKTMVNGTEKFPHGDLPARIEWDLPMDRDVDWYTVDRVFDWGNMIIHGHEITGGFAGYPWYGVGKKASGWKDAIEYSWDYLYLGHFHTVASAELQHRFMLANGKFDSDDQHALANFGSAGCPSQRLAFYSEEHGLISDSSIFLDKRVPQFCRQAK